MTGINTQPPHGSVTLEQTQQQPQVGAQIHAVQNLNGMRQWTAGTKQKPHGTDLDGTAEIHPVAQVREAPEIGKQARHANGGRLVDDDADGTGTEVVHYQDDRVAEEGV